MELKENANEGGIEIEGFMAIQKLCLEKNLPETCWVEQRGNVKNESRDY